jgi:hypothetical protein
MIEPSPLLLTLSDLERLQSIFKAFWYRDTDQTALELAALLEPLALKTSRGAPPSLKTLEAWIKKRGADPMALEGLDSLDRWIIIMKLRGLSYRKIGERLDLSHTGARKRLEKIKKLPAEELPPILTRKALSASEGDERLAQLCFAWWAYRPAIQREPQSALKLISKQLTTALDLACGLISSSSLTSEES